MTRQQKSGQQPGISKTPKRAIFIRNIFSNQFLDERCRCGGRAYCLFYPNCFAAINQQAGQTGSADYRVIMLESRTFSPHRLAFLSFHLPLWRVEVFLPPESYVSSHQPNPDAPLQTRPHAPTWLKAAAVDWWACPWPARLIELSSHGQDGELWREWWGPD